MATDIQFLKKKLNCEQLYGKKWLENSRPVIKDRFTKLEGIKKIEPFSQLGRFYAIRIIPLEV